LRQRFAEQAEAALGLSLEELVRGNGKRRGRPPRPEGDEAVEGE
jgi:hypothetical protein